MRQELSDLYRSVLLEQVTEKMFIERVMEIIKNNQNK
jgi:DNA-binding protein Fis